MYPYNISARKKFFLEEARSTKGGLVRGSPRGGSGGGAPGRRRSFQKICKKINEKLQFLKNFKKM